MFAVFSKEMEPFDLSDGGRNPAGLGGYRVGEDLVALIPAEFAKEHSVFPLERIGKVLTVGMAYPLGVDASGELDRITGHRIKPVLCEYEGLDALIHKYYMGASKPGTQETEGRTPGLQPRSLEAPLAPFPRLEMLPSLSGTVQRVRNTASGPGNSIRDLAGIVSTDPAVAARLLSVANSSAYGLPDRVTNVNLAAILLGFAGTDAVVMAFENVPGMAETSSFNIKAFWLKSMFCAAASMSIAKVSAHGQVADAYTVGVMHEIGRLALAYLFPEKYAKIPPGVPLADRLVVEKELFGMTHPEAGYLLAVQWRLPAIIAYPIRYHHHRHFTGEVEDLVAVVALASAMTEAFGQAGGPAADPLADCGDLLALLEMEKETATRLYEKTCATLKVAAEHTG